MVATAEGNQQENIIAEQSCYFRIIFAHIEGKHIILEMGSTNCFVRTQILRRAVCLICMLMIYASLFCPSSDIIRFALYRLKTYTAECLGVQVEIRHWRDQALAASASHV